MPVFRIEAIEGYRLKWYGQRWLPWVPFVWFVPSAFGISIELLRGGIVFQIGPLAVGIVHKPRQLGMTTTRDGAGEKGEK